MDSEWARMRCRKEGLAARFRVWAYAKTKQRELVVRIPGQLVQRRRFPFYFISLHYIMVSWPASLRMACLLVASHSRASCIFTMYMFLQPASFYLFFVMILVIACRIKMPAFSTSFLESPFVTQTFSAGLCV